MSREIYRVEDGHMRGPYACQTMGAGISFEEHMRMEGVEHELQYAHPIGRVRYLEGTCHYGFSSMMQLRHWFDYFGQYGYDVLQAHDFEVQVYSVPNEFVEDHDRQLIFVREEALWERTEEWPECTKTTRVG